MMGRAWSLAAAAALAVAQQYDPLKPMTAEEILIGRVRVVAAQDLAKLPNFTCVETIERSRRVPPSKRYEFVDTIRLEVAYVEGKELYSWPGEPRFEDRDLMKMVGGLGAIGTGDFVMHAKAVLLGAGVKFEPAVKEDLEGRPVYRFDYRVPRERSGFLIRIPPHEGIVGFGGSVWHDRETLELVRLDMEIDEIPPHLPLKRGEKRFRYKRIPIGEEEYLLPVSMEMTLTQTGGGESRNLMTFSGCRQYTGESTLVFEDVTETEKPEGKIEVSLPESLGVPLRLARDLELGKAARGDLVETVVARDVKRRDLVLLPKGARVTLRISKLECYGSPVAHCWLALLPERFEFGNKEGVFKAAAESPQVESSASIFLRGMAPRQLAAERLRLGELEPGAGLFLIKGDRRLASGFEMLWRTLKD